jgi:filamin
MSKVVEEHSTKKKDKARPSPAKPQNVRAHGPGLKDGTVGQEGNFTLETGEAGRGALTVNIKGPKGGFKLKMDHHPDNKRTVIVRYDPELPGKYWIVITWSDVHIPGSPFLVEIQKAQLTKETEKHKE